MIRIVGWRLPGVVTGSIGVFIINIFQFLYLHLFKSQYIFHEEPCHYQTRTLTVAATGNVNEKVEPCPTTLSTETSPPCNSINFLAIVKPIPVPPNRRVVLPSPWRNPSKIYSTPPRKIPIPEPP